MYRMADRGDLKWKCQLPMPARSHAVGPSTAIVGTGETAIDRDLAATELGIDVSSGDVLWQFDSETDLLTPFVFSAPQISPPSVAVFAEMFGGGVSVLDGRSGDHLWDRQVTHNRLMALFDTPLLVRNLLFDVEYVSGTLIVGVHSIRYVTDNYSKVMAVDVNSGSKSWEITFDAGGSNIEYSDDHVHIQTDEDIRTYDPTGNLQRLVEHTRSGGQGTSVHDGVYYGKSSDTLWAVPLGSDRDRWQATPDFESLAPSSEVSFADSAVFVTDTGRSDGASLYRIDAENGSVEWRTDITSGSTQVSSPGIGRDVAYTVAADGTLFAHDLIDGTEQWRTALPASTDGNLPKPRVSNAGVLIGLGDNYCCVTPDAGSVESNTEESIKTRN